MDIWMLKDLHFDSRMKLREPDDMDDMDDIDDMNDILDSFITLHKSIVLKFD